MNLLKIAAMLLVLGLAFAACSDDDESTGDALTPTATVEATATEEPDLETEAPTETADVETPDPTVEPTEAPTVAATAQPTGANGGGDAFVVNAGDFFFEFPGSRGAVLVGETVEFRLDNVGQASHTLTWYRDEAYAQPIQGGDSGTVGSGASAAVTVTFDVAGSYFFRCEIHPNAMQGGIDAIES